ncbi:unnamed protein product [Rotaria sp. Silwood1]|nr:unnamed protein product [Rotaria sp. Silwood1]
MSADCFCFQHPSGSCLFGDDFVSLQDGSRKQMKDLRSGDKVYSVDKQGQIVKDEIIMILHGGSKTEGNSFFAPQMNLKNKESSYLAPFYTITTSFNQTITLTSDHSIMTYNLGEKRSTMVAANELKVNDYLLMAESGTQNPIPVSITSIELLYKTGFITPMTYTGTLLVNGIVASCYVKHHNKYNEMHTILYPFRLYYYLMKDIFRLTAEPFPIEMQVNSMVKEDEFYGHSIIRSMHQAKPIIKYIVQDLVFHTFLNI